MKFLHTGDLHIGKIVNDCSMLEDQRYILKQIYEIASKERVDALVLAGDIYDRAIPPAEAVVVLDEFLNAMAEAEIPVLLISGNHDSPERVGFAEAILEKQGIYIAGVYREALKQVTFQDEYGKVTFVLMPFVKPAVAGAKSCAEAVAGMLSSVKAQLPTKDRRVLVSHYFVTNHGREPELSDGETTIHVGGLDSVEAELLNGFDYVALGHIHKPQKIGEHEVYYAGAVLAYSFSEAGQMKSVNLVELKEKGQVAVEKINLKPLHEMRKIRGKIEELIQPEIVEAADCRDYIQAQLTNEEELIDPIGVLRSVYPNVMQIVLTKKEREAGEGDTMSHPQEKQKSISELFAGFYEMIRGDAPDEERMKIIREAAKKAGEECYEA